MYRVIDFIGRWSMLDLFVISLMVALVDRGVLLNVRAGPGATAFAGVVVLTMMSARMLDTRLLWDKAAVRGRHHMPETVCLYLNCCLSQPIKESV